MILSGCRSPQGSSAQAIATQTSGPDLSATSKALATSIAYSASLVETAETRKTQLAQTVTPTITPTPLDPGISETATALAPLKGEDLPLPPGEKLELFVSRNQVTFIIVADLPVIIRFFEDELPNQGWIKEPQGTFITDGSALLNYVRNSQKLSLSLRSNAISNTIAVVILISSG